MDTLGTSHPSILRGRLPISFTHHHVELAHRIPVMTPVEMMLCTLSVAAVTADGETVAANFIQHYVADGTPLEREDRGNTLVLRPPIQSWRAQEWSGAWSPHEEAGQAGSCYGEGAGFFEWVLTDEALRHIGGARRLRLLCEVSARREGTPQTGAHRHPTIFELLVNGLRVHREVLPDHPHDTRGALSYLRKGRGAYGYLMRATIEDELLQRLAGEVSSSGELRFRCAVPAGSIPVGGLTVYGPECGRYPIGPTLMVEWEQA
jgi:hypothetical protein